MKNPAQSRLSRSESEAVVTPGAAPGGDGQSRQGTGDSRANETAKRTPIPEGMAARQSRKRRYIPEGESNSPVESPLETGIISPPHPELRVFVSVESKVYDVLVAEGIASDIAADKAKRLAAELSGSSAEVSKRAPGRPRRSLEISNGLASPPSPVTAHNGLARPLPDKAPEFFLERKDKSENPVQFLNRVYADWLGSDSFHIEDLNRLDRRLAPNVRSYCQQRKLNPHEVLPPPLPSKPAEEILAQRRARNRQASAARYARLKGAGLKAG